MRYPGGFDRAVTLSFDDGVRQDMRFIGLLTKYGVKCTFNLNSGRFVTRDHYYPPEKIWKAMVDEDVLPTYSNEYAGIACHSAHHPTLKNASEAEIAEELLSDRNNLELLFGKRITGLAIPNGPYDETTVKVAKLCGMTYLRTTKPTLDFKFPHELCPFDPTCHYREKELLEITERFLTAECKEEPFLLYVWGHTYNFDETDGDWELIENFLKTVSGKDNVFYADNQTIFDYKQKFDMLESSADGSLVYNPTDTVVWFMSGGSVFSVASGETVKI